MEGRAESGRFLPTIYDGAEVLKITNIIVSWDFNGTDDVQDVIAKAGENCRMLREHIQQT
jgi:hypothetical protein